MADSTKTCLLLVEDDPRSMFALTAVLAPAGHRLVEAQDAETALDLFETEAPDIVLCDIGLPGSDGIELLRRVRAHPGRGHTPVIMITAYTDRDRRLRALRTGADEFLEKPIDVAILTARLNVLLSLKRSRDELSHRNAELALRNAQLEHARAEQRALLEFVVNDMTVPRRDMVKALDWIDDNIEGGRDVLSPAVAELRTSIERVDAMVNDLRSVSRLEEGTAPVRRETITLNDVVRTAAQRFTKEAAVRRVDIDIVHVEHVAVPADERLLRRVVENLVDNAVRHAAQGGGHVRVEVRRNRGAEIVVCNDGPPIAALERERIFQKFMRGAVDPPGPGHAGLGLYFCRRAIEAHQGEISLGDAPGWPTCFHVWLPAATRRDDLAPH